MALYLKNDDWRLIAEDICTETDPAKLTLLVDLLCRALDGESDATPRAERRRRILLSFSLTPRNPSNPLLSPAGILMQNIEAE
jgi:hypothetical protein